MFRANGFHGAAQALSLVLLRRSKGNHLALGHISMGGPTPPLKPNSMGSLWTRPCFLRFKMQGKPSFYEGSDPAYDEKLKKTLVSRGPKSISKRFSGTPQHVGPQRELLGWSGARDRRWAPRFSRRTKKFPPRGRHSPIIPW